MYFYKDFARSIEASKENPLLRGDIVYKELIKKDSALTEEEFCAAFANAMSDLSEAETTSLYVDKASLIAYMKVGDNVPYLHVSFLPEVRKLTGTDPVISKAPLSITPSQWEQIVGNW